MISSFLEKTFSLQGKKILFTGAAGGIGSALCMGLAKAGADVALCGRNQEALEKLEKKIRCETDTDPHSFFLNQMDISVVRSCAQQVYDIYGKVDVLVNCAGVNQRDGCLDYDEETYDRVMNTNLKGVFFLSQECAKRMVRDGGGNVIHITSHNTVGMLGGCGVYGAAKSGLEAIMRAQAIEWAKYNIRVNALAPGHIKTPLTAVPTWEDPERSKYLLDRIAMNRPGEPEDLIGIMIYLASDASRYMTGTVIHLDGGCLAGGQPWSYHTEY
jgi:NAD(P)-dependent dehydrogenase (short-subunit alcohol dehydrogenase family)